MVMAICPWCDEELELKDGVKAGTEITCSGCDAELIVEREGGEIILKDREEGDVEWGDY